MSPLAFSPSFFTILCKMLCISLLMSIPSRSDISWSVVMQSFHNGLVYGFDVLFVLFIQFFFTFFGEGVLYSFLVKVFNNLEHMCYCRRSRVKETTACLSCIAWKRSQAIWQMYDESLYHAVPHVESGQEVGNWSWLCCPS